MSSSVTRRRVAPSRVDDDDSPAPSTEASSPASASGDAGSDRSQASRVHSRLRNPMLQVIPFILFTELCERLAFFGFTGSLPIFFSKVYGFSSNLSAELNLLFVSLVFISPVFGA